MRQYLLSCIALFSALSFFPLFAQTDQTVTNLGDIVVRFCNNVTTAEEAKDATKTLSLDAETDVPSDICMYINNAWPTPVTALLNFVDGTVTADQSQKKACQPEWTKDKFGQYVEFNSDPIEVPAWKTIETRAKVTFPAWYAWVSYGCVTLQIEWQNESADNDSMFKIISRRANFIDVVVDWKIELQTVIEPQNNAALENLWTNPSLVVYQTPWTKWYNATLTVKNNGNVSQEVAVTPTANTRFQHPMKWIFTEEKVIDGDQVKTVEVFWWQSVKEAWWIAMTKRILPGQQVSFDFDVSGAVPLWEWSIVLDAKIESTPVFDFESKNITDDMRKTKTESLTTQFFIMPWKLVIAILALLLLLWILLSRKKDNTNTSTKDVNVSPTVSNPSRKVTKTPTKKKKTSSVMKKSTAKKVASTKKDNLSLIEWIWPKIKSVLHKKWIETFADLSLQKISDIRKILKENKLSQHDPKHRKKQATLAKNGKFDELKVFQATINNKK